MRMQISSDEYKHKFESLLADKAVIVRKQNNRLHYTDKMRFNSNQTVLLLISFLASKFNRLRFQNQELSM